MQVNIKKSRFKDKDFTEYQLVGNLERDINEFYLLLKGNFLKGKHFEKPTDALKLGNKKPITYRVDYIVDANGSGSLNFIYDLYLDEEKRAILNNLRIETQSGTGLEKKLNEVFGKYTEK